MLPPLSLLLPSHDRAGRCRLPGSEDSALMQRSAVTDWVPSRCQTLRGAGDAAVRRVDVLPVPRSFGLGGRQTSLKGLQSYLLTVVKELGRVQGTARAWWCSPEPGRRETGHPGEGEDKHRGLEGRLSRNKAPGAVQEVTEGQSGRGWVREGLRVVA